MRRLEFLAQEVRDSSDTNDLNTYSPYELMRYFNDAQKVIQKIIHSNNPSAGIFNKFKDFTPTEGAVLLPGDIYAHSSINTVGTVRSERFSPLSLVSYREFSDIYGYAIVDKAILVPTDDTIRIGYVYKLPMLSYRLGQIESIVGQVVTLSGATIIDDTGFEERYENFSIVDKNGNIKASELRSDQFLGLSFTFDSESDVTTAAVGDYVVCGDFGTSHSLLPDECEPYLLGYVQRRIKDKIVASGAASENIFSQEERRDLEDLFADNSKDIRYPVISDTNYLGL